jgi:tripartite-type tricarboxylate transporter receptor subunit TctC
MLLMRIVSRCALALAVMIAGGIQAQDYPNKPIRIITSGAGGGNDIQSRLIAPAIAGPLGQQVIVDNRGGSLLSAEAASKAPPDGYSLLYAGQTIWVTPLLQKVPYDVRDFVPISQIAREVYILTVHPSLPVKSVKELIALAKSRPGQLNYGSSIAGSNGHLAGELFKSLAGVDIVWVPYKGTAQALTAEISGEVHWTISNPGSVLPHMQSGRLRALAVTSATPSALTPGLPTVAASGLPGFEMISITGLFAPAKTPAAIITRVNQELVRALNLPEMKERFINVGVEAVSSSPEQFAAAIKSEMSSIAKVIKDAGIKIE